MWDIIAVFDSIFQRLRSEKKFLEMENDIAVGSDRMKCILSELTGKDEELVVLRVDLSTHKEKLKMKADEVRFGNFHQIIVNKMNFVSISSFTLLNDMFIMSGSGWRVNVDPGFNWSFVK